MSDFRTFPPDRIDEATLAAAVESLARFGRIQYSVRVDSTNARAFEVLHSIDNLCISFVTESQDMGRGRAGRRWTSPVGAGLLFSTILPEELRGISIPAVGFWAATCVADSVANVCGVTLTLKWPNDLLLDGKKCAGLLCEGRSAGNATRMVVGVGLNVNRPAVLPSELAHGASWLSDSAGEHIDRTALLASILSTYERRFDELVSRPTQIIEAWARRAALDGSHARVKAADGSLLHEGTVRGISSDGALLLDTGSGPIAVSLGDVDVFS